MINPYAARDEPETIWIGGKTGSLAGDSISTEVGNLLDGEITALAVMTRGNRDAGSWLENGAAVAIWLIGRLLVRCWRERERRRGPTRHA